MTNVMCEKCMKWMSDSLAWIWIDNTNSLQIHIFCEKCKDKWEEKI